MYTVYRFPDDLKNPVVTALFSLFFLSTFLLTSVSLGRVCLKGIKARRSKSIDPEPLVVARRLEVELEHKAIED